MSLGEDHTTGTRPAPSPRGPAWPATTWPSGGSSRRSRRSKYWPETAIFVIEDDAQNGPDHVDAHRTVGLVISPYTKRKYLDSTQYSTVSMIRTMELILGLPPLSQYDAAARPMFASFTDKADLAPYAHEPARIDLNEVNAADGLWRRAVGQDGLRRVRQDRRLRAQRDPLAGDQGEGRPAPAGRPPGHRLSAERPGEDASIKCSNLRSSTISAPRRQPQIRPGHCPKSTQEPIPGRSRPDGLPHAQTDLRMASTIWAKSSGRKSQCIQSSLAV